MARLPGSKRRSVDTATVGTADWALAGLLVVLHLLAPQTGAPSPEPSAPWLQALPLLFAVGQGMPLVLRRSRPLPVAVVVVACYAGQCLVVGVVPPFAAWVVIWSLGSSRDRRGGGPPQDRQGGWPRLAAAISAVTCSLVVVAEVTHPGSGASALLVLVTVVVTLAAVLLRSERGRVDALRRRAAAEERLRIARDLHDLLGHGLSVVAVQSSTARVALDAGDATTARAAMHAVESSSRTALGELRQMLGVLTDAPSAAPAPGISDIPGLVDNVRAGGVLVRMEQSGNLDEVPRATQLCAYRVVQEGLTNAVKHAPGALVAVKLVAEPRRLVVVVESTGGRNVAQEVAGGRLGLEGLRARVAAVSGEIHSARTSDGWLLRADLPLPHRDEQPASPGEET